jgi:hypothetical protein
MQNPNSLKFVVVQLGSIISSLNKISDGTADDRTWEIIISLNSVVKDWVIIQKSIKIMLLKPDFLGKVEGYISNGDYYKIEKMLESVKPAISVVEQRIVRITGQNDALSKIDPKLFKDNIVVTYDVLKAKAESENENEPVMDQTIATVEAMCEAIRRLIDQKK